VSRPAPAWPATPTAISTVPPPGAARIRSAPCNCADGSLPNGDLLLDAGGNLYGTAGNGGNSSNDGLIFKLHAGSLDVLYDFCAQQSCADGALPAAGLAMDAAGKFLGVTTFGGSGFIGGTFFRLTP
jgi:uncharacterized repeat protein (TIGR03803 family)